MSGLPKYYLGKPRDADMRVPEFVSECVMYFGIERDNPDGEFDPRYGGTAFMVGIPWEIDERYAHLYLVTAKHVVDGTNGMKTGVGANLKNGKPAFIHLTGSKWYFHPDKTIISDIAVLPASRIPMECHFRPVPLPLLSIPDHVGPGDEVFITGLFTNVPGQQQYRPIVRTGNFALAGSKEEKIQNIRVGSQIGDMEAHLIEARSLGGISGSPVFVRESVAMYMKDINRNVYLYGDFYLLGLVHGHWEMHAADKNHLDFMPKKRADDTVNVGIALVCPTRLILETIMQEELVMERKEREKSFKAKQESNVTTDSSFDLYDKDEFIKDLRKVSRKLPAEEPSQPDEEKSET